MLLINGVEYATNVVITSALPVGTNVIGKVGIDQTTDGYISGERIYNRALTAAEILRIFTAERGFYGV